MAAAAAVSQRFMPLSRPKNIIIPSSSSSNVPFSKRPHLPSITTLRQQRKQTAVVSVATDDLTDVIPVNSNDSVDQQQDMVGRAETDQDSSTNHQVGGFAFESGAGGGVGGGVFPSPSSSASLLGRGEDLDKMVDRAINAAIVLAAGTFAITKLLTVDRDYWHVGIPILLFNLDCCKHIFVLSMNL